MKQKRPEMLHMLVLGGFAGECRVQPWLLPDLGRSLKAQLWFWFVCWHPPYLMLADAFMLIDTGHIFLCSLACHCVS